MYYKIRNQTQNMPVLSSLAISKIMIFKYLENANLGKEITCSNFPRWMYKKNEKYITYITYFNYTT